MRSDKSQRDKFTTPLTFVTFNKIKVNIRADRKLRNLLVTVHSHVNHSADWHGGCTFWTECISSIAKGDSK